VALLCFGAGGGGASLDPQTAPEQALAVALALGGAAALALLFAAVGRAWDAVAVGFAAAECTRQLGRVEARMGAMRLPPAIRARVRAYYAHLWRRNATLQEDDELFSSLSLSLATEVKLNQHADVVLGVPLFAMMDTHVIEGVVAELESHVYLSGDYVPHDDSLYTVRSGLFQMAIATDPDGDDEQSSASAAATEGRFLGRGDHFGAAALLERRHRLATVRALGGGDVVVLTQPGFARVAERYPAEVARLRRLLRGELQALAASAMSPARRRSAAARDGRDHALLGLRRMDERTQRVVAAVRARLHEQHARHVGADARRAHASEAEAAGGGAGAAGGVGLGAGGGGAAGAGQGAGSPADARAYAGGRRGRWDGVLADQRAVTRGRLKDARARRKEQHVDARLDDLADTVASLPSRVIALVHEALDDFALPMKPKPPQTTPPPGIVAMAESIGALLPSDTRLGPVPGGSGGGRGSPARQKLSAMLNREGPTPPPRHVGRAAAAAAAAAAGAGAAGRTFFTREVSIHHAA